MNGFILLSLMVCASPQDFLESTNLGCYMDREIYVRESTIKQYEEFDYLKCKSGLASNLVYKCKKQVIAGCEFTLDDGTKFKSSLTCPK